MKLIRWLVVVLATFASVNAVFGGYQSRTVEEQIRYCAAVAEVRIERNYLGRMPNDKFDDLFCE